MNLWKYLFVMVMTISWVIPVAVFAADEEPSFQNAAQAQHAANVAEASFSDLDEARADNYADEVADTTATETANTRADLVATSYAEKMATEFVEQKAKEHADGLIDQKAREYADSVVAGNTRADWQTEYDAAAKRALEQGAWDNAYEYAIERATNINFRNAWDTQLAEVVGSEDYVKVRQQAYEAAYEAAYAPAYDEAFTYAVSRITGAKIEEINRLRHREHMGWGQIAKMYNVPERYIGNGHRNKLTVNTPEPEAEPPALEVLPLEAEIIEATQRNAKTGWSNGHVVYKEKKGGSKNRSGLSGASVAAEAALSDAGAGKGKSSNGKNNSSAGSNKSDKADKSQSSKSTGGNASGKNNNNGKSSNNGNSGKSNGNSGKSGNNGNGKGNK